MSNWVTICDPLISSNKIKLASYMLLNNDRKQVPVSANTWFKNESTYVTPLKSGLNSGAPEGQAVHAPLVAPVVLLLLQTP
jgi:hypothetical protein